MKPDYWDYATLMEIAIIENNYGKANSIFKKIMTTQYGNWMLNTTIKNLTLIATYREKRDLDNSAICEIYKKPKCNFQFGLICKCTNNLKK